MPPRTGVTGANDLTTAEALERAKIVLWAEFRRTGITPALIRRFTRWEQIVASTNTKEKEENNGTE